MPWTPDYPLELAGSYYLRTHRFDRAVTTLAAIPAERRRAWTEGSSNWDRDKQWRRSPSMEGAHNPFADEPFGFGVHTAEFEDGVRAALFTETRNYGLSAQMRETLIQLTSEPADRLEFAGQMKQLKELARQPGEAGALAGFYYARALYNISWHGSSWRLSAWGRSSYEAEQYADLRSRAFPYYWEDAQIRRYRAIDSEDQYHYPSAARNELDRALKKTANPELKARINYMLADMAQTDRNWWREYQKTEYWQQGAQREELRAIKKSRLRELAAQFGDTTFVRQAGEACPALKEFL